GARFRHGGPRAARVRAAARRRGRRHRAGRAYARAGRALALGAALAATPPPRNDGRRVPHDPPPARPSRGGTRTGRPGSRSPRCALRPLITGWFSEFESLPRGEPTGPVGYGPGAARFAGATYDPTSHYRAARVFDFFDAHELSPDLLRRVSQHQLGLLANRFDALAADPRLIRRDQA